MAKNKLPKLYRRKWLNSDEGSGYIIVDAEISRHWNPKKYPDDRTLDASIEFKDCNRQITLEFYANDMKQYRQRMAKIKLLVDTLTQLQQFMADNPPVKTRRKKDDVDKEQTYLDHLASEEDKEEVSETPASEPKIIDAGEVTLTLAKTVFTKATDDEGK